jgi:hypothetical protein
MNISNIFNTLATFRWKRFRKTPAIFLIRKLMNVCGKAILGSIRAKITVKYHERESLRRLSSIKIRISFLVTAR